MKSKKPSKKQRELMSSWESLLSTHSKPLEKGAKAKGLKSKKPAVELPALLQKEPRKHKLPVLLVPPERSSRNIPSLDSGKGVAALPAHKEYTGDKMLGVAQMSKSNAVPVFSTESIVDIGKMRR